MGSKSSSGSLMKSVESMLPKNMNMKHVLLAVLVGLLLCMLMGQSVEGFVCKYPATMPAHKGVTPGATVEVGSAGNDATRAKAAGLACNTGYTGDPTVSCSAAASGAPPAVLTLGGCTQPGDTSCSTSSGPFQVSPTTGLASTCTSYCQGKNQVPAAGGRGLVSAITPPTPGSTVVNMADKGMCTTSNPGLTDRNACARFINEGDCEARTTTNGCTWTSIKDYADTHSLKYLYEPLLSAMGITRFGCGSDPSNALDGSTNASIDILKRSQVTDKLPLKLGAQGASAVTGATLYSSVSADSRNGWAGLKTGTANSDEYRDFFYLLLGSTVDSLVAGSKKKISERLSDSTVIPENIKTKLIEKVKEIEALWDKYDDENKTVLKKNGGRIIAGYSASDGFVIRNPPTDPIILPGLGKAWHEGPGCPGTWDNTKKTFQNPNTVCPLNTPCNEILGNLPNISTTDRGLGATTYCGLPACSRNEKLTECTVNKALDDVTTGIKEGIQSFLAR